MLTPLNQNSSYATVVIDNKEYDFKVFLSNPEGRYFVFRPEAIKELSIVDTFNNYYVTGHIVIDNSYDVIERPPGDPDIKSDPYIFRGDSRDVLTIQVTPKISDNAVTSSPSDTTKSVFSLFYDFAIYNIEDIISEQAKSKFRKLYLWDYWHQIMLERNVSFSTSELCSATNKANATDAQRSVTTGQAIKGLLERTFPVSDGIANKFSVFESGGTNIFFTTPANYKAQDCLDYLMERHVSSKENSYDASILHIENYPKAWSLMSLKDYFAKAYNATNDTGGELFLERFVVAGYADATTTSYNVVVSRSPKISVFFANTNIIENFSFLPPSGELTQQMLTTKAVHGYDKGSKTFSVEVGSNDYSTVQSIYNTNYVKPMKGKGGKPASNLIGNQLRATNQNIQHIFSTSDTTEQRFGVGRSSTLRDALLLGNAISFRVKGSTYRNAGRFISIDRDSSIPDSVFDDKMLGIYLIVSVTHSFIGNTYYNDLICIKSYNFTDTKEKGNYL